MLNVNDTQHSMSTVVCTLKCQTKLEVVVVLHLVPLDLHVLHIPIQFLWNNTKLLYPQIFFLWEQIGKLLFLFVRTKSHSGWFWLAVLTLMQTFTCTHELRQIKLIDLRTLFYPTIFEFWVKQQLVFSSRQVQLQVMSQVTGIRVASLFLKFFFQVK